MREQMISDFRVDDGFNIARLRIQDVAKSGALRYMVSTYDPYDQVIRDCDEG